MRYFIDTNIFLEVEFKDSKWIECKDLLLKIENSEIEALTSDFIIYSGILEIQSKASSIARIRNFITGISKLSGLIIYQAVFNDLLIAANLMEKNNLDFDDALVVASMKANKIKGLISFDRDFDKVKEISRIEPKDV